MIRWWRGGDSYKRRRREEENVKETIKISLRKDLLKNLLA